MGLLETFREMFGYDEAADEAPAPRAAPTPGMAKIDLHIRRYTLALEQCTKPGKKQELKDGLAYWEAMKRAAALKPE